MNQSKPTEMCASESRLPAGLLLIGCKGAARQLCSVSKFMLKQFKLLSRHSNENCSKVAKEMLSCHRNYIKWNQLRLPCEKQFAFHLASTEYY